MKKPGNYKYDIPAKSSILLFGILPYLLILLFVVVVGIMVITVHWAFVFSYGLLWLTSSVYGQRNESITLDTKFIIIGDRIIWYKNIDKVTVNKDKETLTIETLNSEKVKVFSSKFPTNAHKDFKIKKNKAAKFFKVTQKLIDKVQLVSPETKILIS